MEDLIEGQQMTEKEMLAEVNDAIRAICAGGQSYQIGSRQLNRADLKTLYSIRNDLSAGIQEGNAGLLDGCFVAVFEGR